MVWGLVSSLASWLPQAHPAILFLLLDFDFLVQGKLLLLDGKAVQRTLGRNW